MKEYKEKLEKIFDDWHDTTPVVIRNIRDVILDLMWKGFEVGRDAKCKDFIEEERRIWREKYLKNGGEI